MKITRTLSRINKNGMFFRVSDPNYTYSFLCKTFCKNLVPFPENTLNIKISITNKNPKKKGFKKILYKYVHVAIMNGEEFAIIQSQLRILETLNIEVGDSFWMKGEVVG